MRNYFKYFLAILMLAMAILPISNNGIFRTLDSLAQEVELSPELLDSSTSQQPTGSEFPEDSGFVFLADDQKPDISLDWFKVRIEGDKKIIYLEAGVAGQKDKVERTLPNVPYRLWSRPDKNIVSVIKDDASLKRNINGVIIGGTEVANFTFEWRNGMWIFVR